MQTPESVDTKPGIIATFMSVLFRVLVFSGLGVAMAFYKGASTNTYAYAGALIGVVTSLPTLLSWFKSSWHLVVIIIASIYCYVAKNWSVMPFVVVSIVVLKVTSKLIKVVIFIVGIIFLFWFLGGVIPRT